VSNIPSTAITNALAPVERQANESLRARKIQAQKNIHHTQDVEELDDTAVDSIHDRGGQSQKNPRHDSNPNQDQPHEKVDIESLKSVPPIDGTRSVSEGPSHLDISA
jgi:hypothetical protein